MPSSVLLSAILQCSTLLKCFNTFNTFSDKKSKCSNVTGDNSAFLRQVLDVSKMAYFFCFIFFGWVTY